MITPVDIPEECKEILDRRASKIHSREGQVMQTLAEILTMWTRSHIHTWFPRYLVSSLGGRVRLFHRLNTTHPVVHELGDALRWLGLRDRLRCPTCGSVGTYKPYGALLDRRKPNRPNRCWLCKWCGHYVGPEEIRRAFPNEEMQSWGLLEEMDQEGARDSQLDTPQIVAESYYKGYKVDPWRG